MPSADALDVIFSLLVDDSRGDGPRHETYRQIREVMDRPFDPEEAAAYEQALFEREAMEEMARQGFGTDSDRWAAQPAGGVTV